MEKIGLKRAIFFSRHKISLFVYKGENFILFDLNSLGRKYVRIPNFIISVYFTKKDAGLHLTASPENQQKLEKLTDFLSSYPKKFERPFRKKLILKGLGYKANLTENCNDIELKLGFSHPINLRVPKDVTTKVNKQSINLEGFNKTSVGNFANKIRKLRLPDSYKGKGVWYKNEVRAFKELKKK